MKKIVLTYVVALFSISFVSLQAQIYTTSQYANECVNITRNLRLGVSDRFTNYEVSLLQDFLSPQYLYLPDGPTGYFGNATFRAVKAFQNEYRISTTGYVGPITRSKIAELTCREGGGVGRACPTDAKICPDGRSVGRVGPYCEFASCSGVSARTPIIYSVSPSQVSIGGLVSISGTGFISSGNEVFLNNSSIGFAGLSGAGMLTIVIPRTIGTPCPTNVFCIQGSRDLVPGMYSLKVVNTNGTSNSINLVVTGSTIIQPPTPTPTPTTFSASVTSGNAPLSVQFYADRNTTSCSSNSPYSVTFGDGTQARMEMSGGSYGGSVWGTGGTSCNGYIARHTYTQAGTYTAQLYKTVYNTCVSSYNNTCPLWYSREDLVGTITITVSQSQSQLPTIAEIQSVRTGSTSTIYVGEEARITGTNLALIFPSSGIGARLDVQIGGVNISPYNIMGTSLSFIVPALTPGTYTVTVTNSYGVSNAYTVTVANQNTVAPTIVSFSANPPTRESRSESLLSWVTQNANTCAINGLSVPTTGSTSTRAFTTDTYTLTCVGTGGTVSQTVYVPVYVIDCQEGYDVVNGVCVPQTNSCTKDAWICPGGTTVGRIPPLCNFAECPPYALP